MLKSGMKLRVHLHNNNVLRSALSLNRNHALRSISSNTVALASWDADPRKVNVYADFTVYKSKGAMSIKLIRPTWERTAGSGIKVSRDGTLLLEFANPKGEDRVYDWDAKDSFALSATECAQILDSTDSGRETSFFHDPNKMNSNEGLVTKSLRLAPGRDAGYFFSLTVSKKSEGRQVQYSTSLSSAELRVIRNVMDFAIPRLLGFDEVFSASIPDIKDSTTTSDAPPF